MLHPATIEEYKKNLAEIDTTPVLKECRIKLSHILNSILNQEPVQKLAFGTRFLWEMIAGNNNYGRVLQAIVFAHQPTVDGRNKLKTWYGDRFYFWHTAEQFSNELNMPVSTVRRAIRRLKKIGLITCRIMKNDFGITCYHIALEFDAFFNFLKSLMKRLGYKVIIPDRSDRSFPSYIEENIKKEKKDPYGDHTSSEPQEKYNSPDTEVDCAPRSGRANLSQDKCTNSNATVESLTEQRDCTWSGDPTVPRAEKKDKKVSSLRCRPILKNKSSAEVEQKINNDEKVNDEQKINKDMPPAKHIPEGDRFFGERKQQQPQIREKAKFNSALGHSAFKSIEHMQECQKELAKHFGKTLDAIVASEKAYWIIDAETKGKRSPWVEDFLNEQAIGTWCKKEWEVEPGKIAPAFLAYLRCMLRRDGDTHAQTVQKVSWQLKDEETLPLHWAECKRLIDLERPRLQKAIQLGQNLVALKIPEWIIEVFRPPLKIESVAETAEALGTIAIQYSETVEQAQQQLAPAPEEEIPITIPGGVTVEKVIELVGKSLPAAGELPQQLSPEEEISQMLSDPITREEGLRLAKSQGLPLLRNSEGEAIALRALASPIAVDIEMSEDQKKRAKVDEVMDEVAEAVQQPQSTPAPAPAPQHYEPGHQLYTPPAPIKEEEKISKSDWEKAKAKFNHPFFKRLKKKG